MASNFNPRELKEYAANPEPLSIGPSTLLRYTSTTVTVFDKWPKAKYHFLVLPRIDYKDPARTPFALYDLRALLSLGKEEARVILEELEVESKAVEEMIRDEMRKSYGEGVEWQVMKGFHAIQSMVHIHLHIISSDFISPTLKIKKHWNSFNPKHGFFLHLKDVLGWLDLPEAGLQEHIRLTSQSGPLLKDTMTCWKCHLSFWNVPKLKDHLQMHFDIELASLKKEQKRKQIDLTQEDSKGEAKKAQKMRKQA